ncbi:MAG: membrane protein insertion efficiency factor YidD [Planctomycetota bacterium]|jgi:putative membrane protein insertion efficiency factor
MSLSLETFAPLRELPRRVLIILVRIYQATLSQLLGGQCRFVPTCSQYFIEEVERHGALRGSIKGLRRILRCHPLTKGGYDPSDS